MAEQQKPKSTPGRFARWRERAMASWRRGGDIQRRKRASEWAENRQGSGRGTGSTDAGNWRGGAD
jgi:hypothetical protein